MTHVKFDTHFLGEKDCQNLIYSHNTTSNHLKRLPNLIQHTIKKFWRELLVLSLFLILTLILLYPFSILKMNIQLIGDGGDGYQNLWNLWWVKRSVLSRSNPFTTNMLFYPNGADLYVHSLSPAAGFLTISIQQWFGLVFSYNLLVILSFVLGGYGAYRLALHVTGDRKASFFAGLIFTFSAYHFARAFEHLNLVSIRCGALSVFDECFLEGRSERASFPF